MLRAFYPRSANQTHLWDSHHIKNPISLFAGSVTSHTWLPKCAFSIGWLFIGQEIHLDPVINKIMQAVVFSATHVIQYPGYIPSIVKDGPNAYVHWDPGQISFISTRDIKACSFSQPLCCLWLPTYALYKCNLCTNTQLEATLLPSPAYIASYSFLVCSKKEISSYRISDSSGLLTLPSPFLLHF